MISPPPLLLQSVAALAAAGLGWMVAAQWGWGAGPGSGSDKNPARQSLPEISRIANWESDYALVAASGDPSAQVAAAIAMANRIPPESFARFLENLRRLPAHAAQGMAKGTVLRRWVAHDPEAALSWCRLHSDTEAVHSVIEEWTAHQPSRAAEIFQKLPESGRGLASRSILAGLVRTDREAAMTWLTLMTDPHNQNPDTRWAAQFAQMNSFVPLDDSLRDLARQDPAWLLDRCGELPSRHQQEVRAAVARSLSEQNTQSALDWINTQPDRLKLLEALIHRPHDEAALFAAIAALPPDEQKELPVYSFSTWGRANPKSLVDSLDTHAANLGDALKRQLQASLPQRLAASDSPGELADRMLANPALRAGFGIDSFALAWAAKDPAAASRWVAALANPDDRRIAQTAMKFAGAEAWDSSPTSLRDHYLAMAGNAAIGQASQLLRLSLDDRIALLDAESTRRPEARGQPTSGSALGTMASHFPAETARWLQQRVTTENSQTFLPSLTLVASRWAAEEPTAAAQWAASLPAGDSRAWAAANVAARWARFDEESARRWVASLPAADQAIAARGLPAPE